MRLELKFCSAMKKALLASLFIAGELKWNFVLKVVRVAQEWTIKKRKQTRVGYRDKHALRKNAAIHWKSTTLNQHCK